MVVPTSPHARNACKIIYYGWRTRGVRCAAFTFFLLLPVASKAQREHQIVELRFQREATVLLILHRARDMFCVWCPEWQTRPCCGPHTHTEKIYFPNGNNNKERDERYSELFISGFMYFHKGLRSRLHMNFFWEYYIRDKARGGTRKQRARQKQRKKMLWSMFARTMPSWYKCVPCSPSLRST